MKKLPLLFAFLLPAVCLLVIGFVRRSSVGSAGLSAAGLPPSGFAVVELFTSEGCSSCPAAEKALAKLAADYPENVYVLAFHVDYWDRLGWKDIFSASEYTGRQREYAQLFKLASIYTPQAVVNGRHEFVGSDEGRLRSAVQEGLAAAASSRISLAAKEENGKKVKVSYNIDNPGKAGLEIALVQSQAASQVLRGENEGRKLEHVNVVREFQTLSLKSGNQGVAELKLPDGLQAKDCKIIAFLQTTADGTITKASQALIQ